MGILFGFPEAGSSSAVAEVAFLPIIWDSLLLRGAL